MSDRVIQVKDGEWTKWNPSEDHVCCDCGLTHGVKLRTKIEGGVVRYEMKWTINKAKSKRLRKTGQYACRRQP